MSVGSMASMAEEVEDYRAKVSFQHKFENVAQQLDNDVDILSPTFRVRNIPFRLELFRLEEDNEKLVCSLACIEDGDDYEEFSYNVNAEFQFSLIRLSSTTKSAVLSNNFTYKDYFYKKALSELFPDLEIVLDDDAIKLEVSLWIVEEPQGISEYEPPKKKLKRDLQIVENLVQSDSFVSLLDSRKFSDVTFVTSVDSIKVKAHKAILAARSDVFDRMLATDMKEAKEHEIKIDDMGATALKLMLRHIYSGQLEFPKEIKIDLNICQELVNAGEKYGLQNLKEYAAMAMTEFVSLENAWELFVFAKRLKAEAATKALTSYVGENVYKIMKKV